jgi:hypothetical protein
LASQSADLKMQKIDCVEVAFDKLVAEQQQEADVARVNEVSNN